MPFSKRKSGRDPLQRLSDQRRSLALAGLAAGAVFSAAVFRRKRHGEEPRFEPNGRPMEPAPAPEAPAAAAESEPRPINAAPAPSPLEPTTGELSTEEAAILSVLAQSGRIDDDRTTVAVATSLQRDTADVTDVLRKLGAEGVVSGELQSSSGEEIWAVTERGVRRLGAQS